MFLGLVSSRVLTTESMFLTFGIEDIIGVDFDFEARRNIVIQYINIEFFETVVHVRGEMNTPLECR